MNNSLFQVTSVLAVAKSSSKFFFNFSIPSLPSVSTLPSMVTLPYCYHSLSPSPFLSLISLPPQISLSFLSVISMGLDTVEIEVLKPWLLGWEDARRASPKPRHLKNQCLQLICKTQLCRQCFFLTSQLSPVPSVLLLSEIRGASYNRSNEAPAMALGSEAWAIFDFYFAAPCFFK